MLLQIRGSTVMLRRNFIYQLSLTGFSASTLSAFTGINNKKTKELKIPQNTIILFQGDSITDAGRDRKKQSANQSPGLGGGYVHQTASHLLGTYPKLNLTIHNRGISGNKVYQLAERWDKDCLELRPDVLSILIGVNDFWHTLTHNYKGTVEVYEGDFRKLLDKTLKTLPEIKLILAEPFVLKGGSAIQEGEWFPKFEAYQKACSKIAKEYKTAFIPLQKIFDRALTENKVSYWCPDGVHPSLAGNYLMAPSLDRHHDRHLQIIPI